MSQQPGGNPGTKPDDKRPSAGQQIQSALTWLAVAAGFVAAVFGIVLSFGQGRLAVLALVISALLAVVTIAAVLTWRLHGRVRVTAMIAGIALLVLAIIVGVTGGHRGGARVPVATPHHSPSPTAKPAPKPTPDPCSGAQHGTRQSTGSYLASYAVPDKDQVYSVAYSPDGKTLAVPSDNVTWSDPPVNHGGSLTLWQVTCTALAVQHQVTTVTDPDSKGVWQVAYSPDGKYLAAADGNHTTYVWALPIGSSRPYAQLPDLLNADIAVIAFDAHDDLFTSDINGGVYEWNITTSNVLAHFITPQPPGVGLFSMAVSPDGHTLAVGYSSGVIYLWNIDTDSPKTSLPAQDPKGVTTLAFGGHDGDTLAAGSNTGSTYLWNLTSDSLAGTLPSGAHQQVDMVAFNAAGTLLAVATATKGSTTIGAGYGYAYLWDTATQKSLGSRQYKGEAAMFAVAFSPDGNTLATGDYGASAYLWTVGR